MADHPMNIITVTAYRTFQFLVPVRHRTQIHRWNSDWSWEYFPQFNPDPF